MIKCSSNGEVQEGIRTFLEATVLSLGWVDRVDSHCISLKMLRTAHVFGDQFAIRMI